MSMHGPRFQILATLRPCAVLNLDSSHFDARVIMIAPRDLVCLRGLTRCSQSCDMSVLYLGSKERERAITGKEREKEEKETSDNTWKGIKRNHNNLLVLKRRESLLEPRSRILCFIGTGSFKSRKGSDGTVESACCIFFWSFSW